MENMEEKSELLNLFKKLSKHKNIGKVLEYLNNAWIRAGIIILVLTVFLLLGLLFPMRRKAVAVEKVIKEERYEIIEHIFRMKKQVDGYKFTLPEGKDINWLIDKTVEAAQSIGITLSQVEPGNVRDYDRYRSLSIRIKTECTYSELINFLKKIEGLIGSIHVSICKLKNVGEKAETEISLEALVLNTRSSQGDTGGEAESPGAQPEETGEVEP